MHIEECGTVDNFAHNFLRALRLTNPGSAAAAVRKWAAGKGKKADFSRIRNNVPILQTLTG